MRSLQAYVRGGGHALVPVLAVLAQNTGSRGCRQSRTQACGLRERGRAVCAGVVCAGYASAGDLDSGL